MANYTTSADLLDDVLFRAGEPTDSTSDFYAAALQYLNRAYQALWSGGGELDPNVGNQTWWWLRKSTPGTLTILPVRTTGTVDVTVNNTAITFSSAPSVSVAGYFFKADDHADVFRIATHTAAVAAATLDSVFTGTTDTTAAYHLMKMEYDLASDAMSVLGPMRGYQSGKHEIDIMELSELNREWPVGDLPSGIPKAYAIVGERLTSSDAMTIRFSHGGDPDGSSLIRVDYDYLLMPSDLADDTAEPLVPRQFRKLLADFALAWLLQDKEDSRAPGVMQMAQRGLQAMVKENQRRWSVGGRRLGHIYPRQDQLGAARRPLRTQSGMILG